ncbi:LOW QUALITY PROTEIN: uncharacterized protein ACNS7B_008985 [Menidia menidia]
MEGSVSEGVAIEAPSQSECVSKQPQSNGPAPTRAGRLGRDASRHHGNGEVGRRPLTAGGAPPPHAGEAPPPSASEAPPPSADRLDSSNGQLMVGCSTDNICGRLPAVQQKGEDGCPSPVCAPSSSTSPIQTSTSKRHHQRANQKRLSKDPASSMTDAAHIKEVAGDDVCVHLLLSCLFCDLLYLCWAVGQCLGGGAGGAGPEMACCGAACCEAACCGAACCEAACCEAACQALLDCTVLEDCCGSADCLEVCLDCCSICFPS